jgi:hypothetical protein
LVFKCWGFYPRSSCKLSKGSTSQGTTSQPFLASFYTVPFWFPFSFLLWIPFSFFSWLSLGLQWMS